MTYDTRVLATQCLSAALGRTVTWDEELNREGSEEWDSLKHVELMFVVEDETGKIMTPDELTSIVNLETLEVVLRKLTVSK